MIDPPINYRRLEEDYTEEERVEILDPICEAVAGKAKLDNGIEILANRTFAIVVLDLYKEWQKERYERE